MLPPVDIFMDLCEGITFCLKGQFDIITGELEAAQILCEYYNCFSSWFFLTG
jgi:hypothetical protein